MFSIGSIRPLLGMTEHIEEWRKLAEGRGDKLSPHRNAQPHERGVKKAARELGVSAPEDRRASTIASMPEPVK